jgi:glycine dehydrogenase subunit 1
MASYLLNTKAQTQEMLDAIGIQHDQLFDAIPRKLRLKRPINLPVGQSEMEVYKRLSALASQNKVYSIILRGAGAEQHFIPSVVKQLSNREEFVSAYTPYQAEFSQGILQSIFEYQTDICELTGMDGANASVYDGATAAAESIAMVLERTRKTILIADSTHPHVIETIKTYTSCHDTVIEVLKTENGILSSETLKQALNQNTAALLIQQPNYLGCLENVENMAQMVHASGAKLIVYAHPLTLAYLKSPRALGADIAIGEAQPLGLSLAFGGPYLGYMATTNELIRRLPGRIVGQTLDTQGRRSFVLTLQAREQHIRREKATSSLCSNQALCALTASVYVAAMGPQGLKEVAEHSLRKAHYFQTELEKIGFELKYNAPFFHEFVTKTPVPALKIEACLDQHDILSGLIIDPNEILWCVTETTTKAQLDEVVKILKEACL